MEPTPHEEPANRVYVIEFNGRVTSITGTTSDIQSKLLHDYMALAPCGSVIVRDTNDRWHFEDFYSACEQVGHEPPRRFTLTINAGALRISSDINEKAIIIYGPTRWLEWSNEGLIDRADNENRPQPPKFRRRYPDREY